MHRVKGVCYPCPLSPDSGNTTFFAVQNPRGREKGSELMVVPSPTQDTSLDKTTEENLLPGSMNHIGELKRSLVEPTLLAGLLALQRLAESYVSSAPTPIPSDGRNGFIKSSQHAEELSGSEMWKTVEGINNGTTTVTSTSATSELQPLGNKEPEGTAPVVIGAREGYRFPRHSEGFLHEGKGEKSTSRILEAAAIDQNEINRKCGHERNLFSGSKALFCQDGMHVKARTLEAGAEEGRKLAIIAMQTCRSLDKQEATLLR